MSLLLAAFLTASACPNYSDFGAQSHGHVISLSTLRPLGYPILSVGTRTQDSLLARWLGLGQVGIGWSRTHWVRYGAFQVC